MYYYDGRLVYVVVCIVYMLFIYFVFIIFGIYIIFVNLKIRVFKFDCVYGIFRLIKIKYLFF